jgi:two-component system, sensor histidine kinase and response regulator
MKQIAWFTTFLVFSFVLLAKGDDSVSHVSKRDSNALLKLNHNLLDSVDGKADGALQLIDNNLPAGEKFKFHKGIASALNNVGRFYKDNGKFDVAIEYHFKALKISKEINDGPEVAKALLNIGMVLGEQGLPEKALDFYLESVKISEEINEPLGRAIAYNNVGCLYHKLKDMDKALEAFKKALTARQELEDETGMAAAMNNIAVAYKAKGNYKNALEYFSKSLTLFKKHEDIHDYGLVLLNMGEIYEYYKEYDKALLFYNEGLKSAKRAKSNKKIVDAYNKLAQLYERQNNFKKAYEYEKLSLTYKDSLFNEKVARQIAENAMRYELEKLQKEFQLVISKKEVEMLNHKSRINELELKTSKYQSYLFISGLIIFMTFALVLYIRYKSKKKLTNKLEEHNNTVISQNVELQRMYARLATSENELRKLNTTKDKFFSIISHDLRSPLNTLSGFLHIIRNDVQNLSQDEIKSLTTQIERSIRGLLGLLDNLLKWSLSQMGSIEYNPQKVNIKEVIDENIALLGPNAKSKNILLEVKVSDHIYARADMNMIQLVVRNVLSNAIKFTNINGSIKIKAVELNDQIKIFIEDNGVGISKEDQHKLFVLGNQFVSGTSNEKGTGLGLYLCKEFMEKNGGSIEVESETDQGTVFILRLPKESDIETQPVSVN